jgi:hypothetical protein
MTLNRGTALLAHAHPKLLFRGSDFDARVALRAAVATVREALCGIRGHEYYERTGNNRIFLQCLTCSRETPGWRIDVKTRNRTSRDRVAHKHPAVHG